MAKAKYYPAGTKIRIPKNTPIYKDPTPTSKKVGVIKTECTKTILEFAGSSSLQYASARPYKIDANSKYKGVWLAHEDVRKIEDADSTPVNGNAPTGGEAKQETISHHLESANIRTTESSDQIVNTMGSTGYSDLVNDPVNTSSAFTLSEKGRQLFNDDEQIKRVIENMGIVDRERLGDNRIKLYSQFDRNGCVDPYNGFVGARSYVFFTRPDLHIFSNTNGAYDGTALNEELMGIPFFTDMADRYPEILYSLQSSCSRDKSPFINLLTNTISGPVELPSIMANKNLETGTNAYGTNIQYRGTSHPSDENISLTIEFTDNRYLEVFMFFKMYDEYEKQKNLGRITPANPRYIRDKIISDQISIFRIDTAEDGESILYFAKWTGCMPLSVPTEVLSDIENINGNLQLSIQWHAHFFDDMDLDILSDFNAVVTRRGANYFTDGKKDIMLYDPVTGMSNGEWGNIPYIAVSGEDNSMMNRLEKLRKYKLKWR